MGATDTTETTKAAGTMDTRERILHETWRMLEARRGQKVRLEDIAKAAGVSRQAIYLHFGSRADLFIATVRYADERLHAADRMRAACEAEGNQAIEALITWWASYVPDIYGLAKALLAVRETDEAASAAWADRMSTFYDGCVLTLQSIARDGHLADGWTVEQAADFLWSLLSVDTWERLTVDRGWSKEQYIERLRMVAKHALTRQP